MNPKWHQYCSEIVEVMGCAYTNDHSCGISSKANIKQDWSATNYANVNNNLNIDVG